jgi:hypothetical protein
MRGWWFRRGDLSERIACGLCWRYRFDGAAAQSRRAIECAGKMATLSVEQRKSLGKRARERIVESFSIATCWQNYRDMYAALLRAKGVTRPDTPGAGPAGVRYLMIVLRIGRAFVDEHCDAPVGQTSTVWRCLPVRWPGAAGARASVKTRWCPALAARSIEIPRPPAARPLSRRVSYRATGHAQKHSPPGSGK